MAAFPAVFGVSGEHSGRHRGEHQLVDEAEFLWRQVPAAFMDKQTGVPSSQTFRPFAKDQGKLSVARGSVVSPAEARRRHQARGYNSVGVLGVTVSEVTEQTLSAWDDSAQPGVPQEHGYIDFRELPSKGKQERCAARLLHAALIRGWAEEDHPTADSGSPTAG